MENYYATKLSGNIYWRNPITPHTKRKIVERREYLNGTIKYVDNSGRIINIYELNPYILIELNLEYLQIIRERYRLEKEKYLNMVEV
jgi:hypothetical protein